MSRKDDGRGSDKRGSDKPARKAAVTTWRKTPPGQSAAEREKTVSKKKRVAKSKPSKGSSGSALGHRKSLIALHRRVAKDALSRILSTPLASLVTVLVLGVAMSLPAALSMTMDNLRDIAGTSQATSVRVSLYLESRVTDKQAVRMREDLVSDPAIARVSYVSPSQGLLEFEKYSGLGEALRLLDDNPLPGVLEVEPKDSSPLAVSNLKNRLVRMGGVDEVRVDSDWLKRLHAMLKLGDRILTGVSILIFLAVLLAVGNTIRLLVVNRKDEIRVIKLVGGSDGFVILPFLYSGFWYGLLGGLLASVMTLTLWLAVSGPAQELAGLYQSSFRPSFPGFEICLTLMLTGMFMGILGAFLSSWRQLRHIDP